MRTFVTGITGFAGGHLAEHLGAHGDEVAGCSRHGTWPSSLNHLAPHVRLVACDLTDPEATQRLLRSEGPEVIYHLAALAHPRTCREAPDLALRHNVLATENLYEAIRQIRPSIRVLQVSTSYVYAAPRAEDLPLRTDAPIRTDHPYAATKWEAEQLSKRFAEEFGLDIVRVRPFNHTGPRQPAGYIVPDWAKQLAAIETGKVPPVLCVGNLTSRRDYTDVRDIVRAYRLLVARAPRNTVYNLGSGVSHSGQDILRIFRTLCRTEFEVRQDPDRLGGNEAAETVADASPLRALTNWRPEISLEATLDDTLEFWRVMQGGCP